MTTPLASASLAGDGKGFDQFYTKPEAARRCWLVVQRAIKRLKAEESDYWFVEPAAGCGSFYQILPPRRRIGIDIEPRKLPNINDAGIITEDYLSWQPKKTQRKKRFVVVGNPPFGRRGKLAVAFFNHSAFAEMIAFIVPVSFRKHFIHQHLLDEYTLIEREPLLKDSFCTPNGKDYKVNTEFQVWTRLEHGLEDKRQRERACITHDDFELGQYNNTEQALSVFDAPFDFAVPCQGYQDYSRRETSAAQCEKHKQWMLFKEKKKGAAQKLREIDYAALANSCATVTPGFRKNDVVRHYVNPIV